MDIRKLARMGAVVLAISVVATTNAAAERRIGILKFSDEARYIEATKGITDKLKTLGFGEPKTAYVVESAGANKAKTDEIVQKYAAAKFDLIITLGTSSAIAMSKEIKEIPIVFSMVYDPIDAGVAKAWKSSGNNTTGTSTKIPMSRPMDILLGFTKVKRLAVLYTPGEKNSESQLKDLQAVESTHKIRVVPVRLTKAEEITQLLPEVLRTVEAVYITGSNLVNSQIDTIVELAGKAHVVTVTHLEDLLEKGVMLGVCTDSYSMGLVSGEQAAKILKGAKPSSIPIELAQKVDVILNMKSVKKDGYTVPADFMKIVTRRIE
jgi:putative tryptophan/tyrosine transport system substrate-binding protein